VPNYGKMAYRLGTLPTLPLGIGQRRMQQTMQDAQPLVAGLGDQALEAFRGPLEAAGTELGTSAAAGLGEMLAPAGEAAGAGAGGALGSLVGALLGAGKGAVTSLPGWLAGPEVGLPATMEEMGRGAGEGAASLGPLGAQAGQAAGHFLTEQAGNIGQAAGQAALPASKMLARALYGAGERGLDLGANLTGGATSNPQADRGAAFRSLMMSMPMGGRGGQPAPDEGWIPWRGLETPPLPEAYQERNTPLMKARAQQERLVPPLPLPDSRAQQPPAPPLPPLPISGTVSTRRLPPPPVRQRR